MRELTFEDLERKVPAAFNTTCPSLTVSDRYRFVPSLPIIQAIMQSGFVPVAAYQPGATRNGIDYNGKHFIRFRSKTNTGLLQKDDVIPELIYSNAHNGTACNRLTLGIFRCWCDNQATVKEGDLYSHAFRHVGNIQSEVAVSIAKVVGAAPLLQQRIDKMKSVQLDEYNQNLIAAAGVLTRWNTDNMPGSGDLVQQVLKPRRVQDEGSEFWRVYNRVQENIIKGDFEVKDSTRKSGYATVRPVKSFVSQTNINQKLWSAAMELLKRV